MKIHRSLKTYHQMLILWLALLACSQVNALPFAVTPSPNTPFPTVLADGTTVNASYIITNNTASPRNNSYLKYLPPNVSVLAGGCGSQFNLAPKGQSGDSCTLNLGVAGAINANDPNASNHLFVCFPGGKSCAGTPVPLNIAVLKEGAYNFADVATFGQTVYVGGFNSTNNGQLWQLLEDNWNVAVSAPSYYSIEDIATVSPSLVYIGGPQLSSGPFGAGWVASFNPQTNHTTYTNFNTATTSVGVASLTYGNGVLYVGGQDNPTSGTTLNTPLTGQVWSYQNGTWSSTNLPSPNNAVTNVSAMAFSTAQNKLYAAVFNNGFNTTSGGGYSQILQYYNGIWIDLGLPTSDTYPYFVNIYGLAIDSTGNLYAGGTDSSFSGAVWKFNGASWSSLNFPTTTEEVSDIAFNSHGVLYAGGYDEGNFNGQIWFYLNNAWISTNLTGSSDIWAIAINSSDLLYAVGTYINGKAGVWSINANAGA